MQRMRVMKRVVTMRRNLIHCLPAKVKRKELFSNSVDSEELMALGNTFRSTNVSLCGGTNTNTFPRYFSRTITSLIKCSIGYNGSRSTSLLLCNESELLCLLLCHESFVM
ncbi:unnamed protein product [Brassica rapa subsp. narinosa]